MVALLGKRSDAARCVAYSSVRKQNVKLARSVGREVESRLSDIICKPDSRESYGIITLMFLGTLFDLE